MRDRGDEVEITFRTILIEPRYYDLTANLDVRTEEPLLEIEKAGDGTFQAKTPKGTYRARKVVLATGQRGNPRKLGVPGEELPKVAYSLLDANSYQGRRILVVGGGDSALGCAFFDTEIGELSEAEQAIGCQPPGPPAAATPPRSR